MILIADSGSTKSDWIIKNGTEEDRTSTMGFNPFFHDSNFIASKLLENPKLVEFRNEIKEIQYFGAGCSNSERKNIVEQAFKHVFPNADNILVEHDMVGAVFASCQNKPGIVCILGTGSNSCYYDSEKIHQPVMAIGHILGDEGSGAYFGKKIISAYLRNQLPNDLHQIVQDAFGMSQDELYSTVYKQKHVNVFLASVMKKLANYDKHPYIQKLVKEGLKKFSKISIECHPLYKTVPVHFIGSIGYYYQNLVREVAKEAGFEIGRFIQKPIEELSKSIQDKKNIIKAI